MVAGRNVVLGVCGSIAAVRCVELVHELRRRGATVRAVMSPASAGIINPQSLEFATTTPVVTEITGAIEHVELCGDDGWGDVLLIAPTTANTIGKMAGAIDDTPVTTCATTAIGGGMPVVVAPAMHEPMWNHPGVLDSIEALESWGIDFVPPRIAEGKAKIADDETIVTATTRAVTDQSLSGRTIVVTSGPTSEPIDPVRVLTNRSSGRMGRAVARACWIRGASVVLVHNGPSVEYATVKEVETGAEMRAAVADVADDADALVSAAAIGDFEVESASDKLDSGTEFSLDLTPAPKLLDDVREAHPDLVLVGFKAEHEPNDDELVSAAREQLERIGAAFVVANDAAVMGEPETRALLVTESDNHAVSGTKDELGAAIADRLGEVLSSD